jgi:glutamate racemase
MADNRPIGVFDSGLGGLTVLKELENILPNESFVYFGDTGRVPYGSRSNDTIISYARQDENFLLSKGVKYIVAACGTVSAVAADTANDLPVNFMGVADNSVKSAVSATKSQRPLTAFL